ncbi:MAG: competence protein ComK [Clostridium sp.]|nr:MAG: competence protein ComK [Clostridium sp.]
MDESCRYNGSTIEGRAKGTESLTGISYKAPIMVKEEEKYYIFFQRAHQG